ncbi:UMP kinase [Candidatus Woesearchaeota archaeon]|nr:UMP kinase [Candidatus Woesearchaeota archaeon]
MKTIILSLGGSIIVPNEVDYFFLKEFKSFILRYLKKDYRFIIFCGGGKTNSKYNTAAQRVSHANKEDLDWLGIMASRLNAELIRSIFGESAYKKVIYNPTKKIKTKKQIIIAAGWKPGWSTDYDAVLVAKQLQIKEIINLTNISYVYDKDPRNNKDAKKIYEASWKEYRKIIGNKWSPRLSTPFDPIASKEAQKIKLKVVIMKGTDLKNLENYLEGKSFDGTVIG